MTMLKIQTPKPETSYSFCVFYKGQIQGFSCATSITPTPFFRVQLTIYGAVRIRYKYKHQRNHRSISLFHTIGLYSYQGVSESRFIKSVQSRVINAVCSVFRKWFQPTYRQKQFTNPANPLWQQSFDHDIMSLHIFQFVLSAERPRTIQLKNIQISPKIYTKGLENNA